jgi:pimeloyl-ACP methyl ester carboxylesterase
MSAVRFRLWFFWFFASTLISGGMVVAEDQAARCPIPAPGKLVDVGGWKLHINCTGEKAKPSDPTVILEAGLGDFSVEWSLVQPGIAKFARVCSYDRAGDGLSELGPHPRTFRQIVYELHTLLRNADIKPPFVLVGHSYGGWLVRLYESTYPEEVVGMVLVEAGADIELRTGAPRDGKEPWLYIFFQAGFRASDGKWRPIRVRIAYHAGRIKSRSIETPNPDDSSTWKEQKL